MMHFLIATGGSKHSQIAVELGGQLAQQLNSQLTLLTIIKQDKQQAIGEQILHDAVASMQTAVSPLLAISTKIRVGHSAEQIIAEASSHPYDLIILGESTQHDLLSRLVGPTAKRVVEHATCPILIAKGRPKPIHNILLCDSGLRHPALLDRLREQMPELLRDTAVSVTILHVMSQISAGPGVSGQQLRADATELIAKQTPEGQLLGEDIDTLATEGITVKPKIRHGFVVDEIVDEVDAGEHDLVVIGAHHNGGWQRFLLDDLAHQIILKSNRPILILQ